MKKLTLFLIISLSLLACRKKPAPSKPMPKWPDYTKGYNLLQVNKDSAFYYFNRAVNNSRDSQEVAYAYASMAVLQSDAGDYFGCQESLIQSLRFQDNGRTGDRQYLSTTYHELGLASFNLGNYAEAIRFYDRALQLSKDSSSRPAILNNQANAYQKMHRYTEALRLYHLAFKQPGLKPKTYARLLTNIATTQWLREPQFKAASALRKALEIRRAEQDQWGQNSSYAHLSDYYSRSQPDSALWYARQMYGTAIALRSADDELEALEKLIKLSPGAVVRSYFLRYQQLNDSLRTARNAAKNQFALIRYQAEKQKADNLQLQKDNIVQRYQLNRQRIISGVILMVLISGSIITAFWLKKRKERLQLQAQKQIQENKLNLSKKVHDVVANRLYSLIMSIEHEQVTDQEQLLPDLEELYQQSRDISYDLPVVTAKPYHQQVAELLGSFHNDRIAVLTTGNYESTWADTPALIRTHIRYILLELMVNMKKHSQASQVGIRFERLPEKLTVVYTDNGIGLPQDVNFGNGLNSTGNRINELGGSITFGSGRTNGLQVTLVFPIAQP